MANLKTLGIFLGSANASVQVTTSNILAHSIFIQALPNNSKRVAIGNDTTVRAGSGATNPSGSVVSVLGKPSDNESTPPSFQRHITTSPGGVLLSQHWFSPEADNDGVLVSFEEG